MNSGLTTIHDWSHNIISGAYADADLSALRDVGIRARFSYGYSRNLQLKPEQTADLADIARVKREWFGSSNDGLLTMGFASRGPGDTPPQVYQKEWENARSLGIPITQHAGRSIGEIKKFAASRSYIATGSWVRMFSSFTPITHHRKNAS